MMTIKSLTFILLLVTVSVLACGATSATPSITATIPRDAPPSEREQDLPMTAGATAVTNLAKTEESAASIEAVESSTPLSTATAAETSATKVSPTATLTSAPKASTGASFYVAPHGSPDGDGSLVNPWDLQTALSHPPAVQPGDTIWLRGGTYTGIFTTFLEGEEDAPIIVRSYPDEWAIIDTQATSSQGNAFNIRSHWTYYRDFELTNTRVTDRGGGMEFQGGTYNKFINLIIHDMARSNSFGEPNEFYGCIFYNNGLDGGQGHQLYVQNADAGQPSRVVDSIIINGFAFGVHAYAGGVGLLNGIHLIGNVWFNNGVAQTVGDRKDNVIIGGVNGTSGILLQENMGWAPSGGVRSVSLGRYSDLNEDITLRDNYLVGSTIFYNTWQSVTMTGNTFFSMLPGDGTNFDPTQFSDNDYLYAPPDSTEIFIRPNKYEAGRAHIAVYNWELEDTVAVDVTGVLLRGDIYEVRNGQNYFAPPLVSGEYTGDPIVLPLNDLEPAQPVGSGLIEVSEYTGKSFNVFVLIRTGSAPAATVYAPIVRSR